MHCAVVENGLEAVNAVQKDSYDLVLMDVMCASPCKLLYVVDSLNRMPVMSGIEATEKILAMPKTPGIVPPVIVALTAHVFKEDQQRCLRAGMAGVLTKPIRRTDLQAVLEKIERERYMQPIEAPAQP